MKTNLAIGSGIIATVYLIPFLIPVTNPSSESETPGPRVANEIRASSEEMRFIEIPWVFDLFEGLRLANEENRPVFLYTVSGDPLDDC